jgi:hypothetical protein
VQSLYAAILVKQLFSGSGIKLPLPKNNCKETSLTASSINDLSKGAALDLVAILASGELLVVGLVFAGDESSGKPVQEKIN